LLCFRCGYENPHGTNVCGRCSAKLPKLPVNVAPTMRAPKTARLMKILDLVNKTLDGKAPQNELLEDIDVQIVCFEGWKKKYSSIPIHKSLKEEFQPQINKALEGINLYLECFDILKHILEETSMEEEGEEGEDKTDEYDDEKVYFELSEEQQNQAMDAMEKARAANEALNDCYELSEESVRKTREENIMYEDDSSIL